MPSTVSSWLQLFRVIYPKWDELDTLVDERQAECAIRSFQSGSSQDVVLLPTLLRAARNRTFVDIGAHNGRYKSNTYMLESCFGWSGVLIEANSENFAGLKRSGRGRSSTLVHAAVCPEDGGHITISARGGDISGDLSHMAAAAIQKYRTRLFGATEQVPCAPLSTHMARASLDRADFFSLDVEGSEAIVLGTVDPARFGLITVELDGRNRTKDESVRAMLRKAGMLSTLDVIPKGFHSMFPHLLGNDEVWVHPRIRQHLYPSKGVQPGSLRRAWASAHKELNTSKIKGVVGCSFCTG